jgi:predicted exporter
MASIAFFGAQPLRVASAIDLWPIPLVGVLVAVSSHMVLRDWRRSLAVLLSSALAVQVGVWAFAHAGVPVSSATLATLLIVVAIVFALQLSDAQEASGVIATEDDAAAGSERAIETKAMPVCVASVVGIQAMLPFGGGDLPTWDCCAVTIAAAAISAVLFQPAIVITIEGLVPRAATIAARYRL